MTDSSAIRVVPLAGRAGLAHGRFGPEDAYIEAVWLPVLGPASFVLWRRLARDAVKTPGFGYQSPTARRRCGPRIRPGNPVGHRPGTAASRTLRARPLR
jgi:hypothetical protein